MDPHHPYSDHFSEHYWSGGAAEKNHTYLLGNQLPTRFPYIDHFCIAELGFGTGLNCLLATELWLASTPPGAHLTYISYELYPINIKELKQIHAAFPTSLQILSADLLTHYNQLHPGWNILGLKPNVTLHLYVGDAATGLTTHPEPADCWFLDGFSPKNNPDLWTFNILSLVKTHSRPAATASTYSVASRVRNTLESLGFTTEIARAYPPKNHMLKATLKP